ncbi:MAG: cyanophycin synthetase [Candidatus Doudnabacteria bacterium]|nr:cyanophycin synthetase [Candidatus Doudnabacteria bacterium]
MKRAFATPILARLASLAGVKVKVEPHYGYAGQITLPDGRKRYFRGTNFDLNGLGASEIAKDKDYANFFLAEMGYPIIEGRAFFSPEWAQTIRSRLSLHAAYAYAKRLGFPVVVKPNSLSQGSGVAKVYNRKEFFQAARAICKKDRVFLVQRVALGRDYRVVVLDGEVISAYERLPLQVVGDGRSTISRLLRQKQEQFERSGRDTAIKQADFRITSHLKRQGMTRRSVPAKGQVVTLLDNRNLSSGGDAVDVTQKIHPTFRQLCVRLVSDMGLRYCGVDFMVEWSLEQPVGGYRVIEVNAAPGIDNYANVGAKQRRIVESMYLKILKALAK